MSSQRKPVLLVIRDGWGDNPHPEQDSCNATVLAKKPCDDMLHARYPVALVKASGLDVGLPDGVMGNSEVGHENIGAGRVVNQELVRINKLFSDGLLAANPVWKGAVDRVKSRGSKLHFMGIVSDAGVHGMLEHLYGLLRQAKAAGLGPDQVFIHAFTDGRDTPPRSGADDLARLCAGLPDGVPVATVSGRYYA
ncbi:MAG TPA: 2,3-bisphosphoglycerate-independent phosphoglycerate mutase, partial [Opitutaceae bacterium]